MPENEAKVVQDASFFARPNPTDGTRHGAGGHAKAGFWSMTLGSVGVVYGDIGTSPLYALREALSHTAKDGIVTRTEVIGVVSLLIWALVIVVTIKYVLFILYAENKGEGGTLSLMALAQSAVGKKMGPVFLLGVTGAALFYGDAILTPAVSVLSAVEGMKLVTPVFEPYVIPTTILILVALFAIQGRGTAHVARFFGPICVVWFIALTLLGLLHIGDDLGILNAFNPYYAVSFVLNHGLIGVIVLGAVFLAVTGAEALYADLGHFGRKPIQVAWLALVFPALVLNYLGQGALILRDPANLKDPFFLMSPEWALLPLVILATLATVIASQAVITGAFSLTQQAIQLGLLPRMEIRHTSDIQRGQIYLPKINWLLMTGVIILVMTFKSSSALASAYGIAVTGTMVVTTSLAYIVVRRVWGWNTALAAAIIVPLLSLDLAFFGANLLKVADGGYVPLLMGLCIMLLMWTWVRGTRILFAKEHKETIPLVELLAMLEHSNPYRARGTAVFLTSDPDAAPGALMHNLKHNTVIHERNVIFTVKTLDQPYVNQGDQFEIAPLNNCFTRVVVKTGYMEPPRIPRLLNQLRRRGLEFELMKTSFFLGRRSLKASPRGGMPLWQDHLFIAMARSATSASDYFHIPNGRVVELGSQISV